MVDVDVTRSLLLGLADALPDEGHNLITRIDIRKGWGNAISVRIHAGASAQHGPIDVKRQFKKAVDDAMGTERHLVMVEWDYSA
jgi:hypothetical protein